MVSLSPASQLQRLLALFHEQIAQGFLRQRLTRRSGSSPRLRGTDLVDRAQLQGPRFIPAPAGNSSIPVGMSTPDTVHPRACGEQISWPGSSPASPGSSPRLRGTGKWSGRGCRRSRFIPAPAGNRGSPLDGRISTPVHPRACGEQVGLLLEPLHAVGSSPRLRGTG